MSKKTFYSLLRKRDSGLFGTSLSAGQVTGMEGIFKGFATDGDGRDETLAYGLATTYHETGRRMVPVREGFASSDAGAIRAVAKLARKRGPNSAPAKYGKPAGPYGHVYYGRGRVQETWLDNYAETSKDVGIDFVKYPEKRLDPEIDARILFRGLLDGRWNGRGKGLAYYIPTNGKPDLENARRTVNITDHWEKIADYYKAFLKVIKAAGGAKALASEGKTTEVAKDVDEAKSAAPVQPKPAVPALPPKSPEPAPKPVAEVEKVPAPTPATAPSPSKKVVAGGSAIVIAAVYFWDKIEAFFQGVFS
jgi:hypothetical protein